MKSFFNSTARWLAVGLLAIAGTAVAKDIDWVQMNPAFKDATYVKDPATCFECHDEVEGPFSHTIHNKAFQQKMPELGKCETCHGPRSIHANQKEPGREFAVSPQQMAKVCLSCHQQDNMKHWKGSVHNSDEVNCTSCHNVMAKKSERYSFKAPTESQTCYTCHSEVRGQMNKASHHPVREGKMECSSCHNSHGSATESLLLGNSVNETCYTCHQEKRGPFLWEHAPARENCLTCHDAHGSNNRKLQNGKDAFMCLSCHTYGGHINLPRYNRTSNPTGEGCVNCHMTIHGSNSPSGRKLTR